MVYINPDWIKSLQIAGEQQTAANVADQKKNGMEQATTKVERLPDGKVNLSIKGANQEAVQQYLQNNPAPQGQAYNPATTGMPPAWSQQNLQAYGQALDTQPQAPTAEAEGGGFLGALKNISKSYVAGGGSFGVRDRRHPISSLLGAITQGQNARDQEYKQEMSNYRKNIADIQKQIQNNEIDLDVARERLKGMKLQNMQVEKNNEEDNKVHPWAEVSQRYQTQAERDYVMRLANGAGLLDNIGGAPIMNGANLKKFNALLADKDIALGMKEEGYAALSNEYDALLQDPKADPQKLASTLARMRQMTTDISVLKRGVDPNAAAEANKKAAMEKMAFAETIRDRGLRNKTSEAIRLYESTKAKYYPKNGGSAAPFNPSKMLSDIRGLDTAIRSNIASLSNINYSVSPEDTELLRSETEHLQEVKDDLWAQYQAGLEANPSAATGVKPASPIRADAVNNAKVFINAKGTGDPQKDIQIVKAKYPDMNEDEILAAMQASKWMAKKK